MSGTPRPDLNKIAQEAMQKMEQNKSAGQPGNPKATHYPSKNGVHNTPEQIELAKKMNGYK
jgi:hypothetical protein